MVVSCRIFRLKKKVPLITLQRRLGETKILEKFKRQMNEKELEFFTTIKGVTAKEGDLHGSIIYEFPISIPQADGGVKYDKEANIVNFVFAYPGSPIFFIPFASRGPAETVATKLNSAFFKSDLILKQSFSTQVIEEFLRRNRHVPRICNWADLDIPGTSKSALGGADLSRSPDFRRYDQHGYKSSVMVTLKQNGWTIRISQVGGIAFYTGVSEKEILQFVKNKILPLL